ncbi:MAG TPA: amidohydrolase family protein [Thermodesulfobacteriota bacterium]|nr:amidohydrolase family protein [Thermodesulfobacteriota bacterium]
MKKILIAAETVLPISFSPINDGAIFIVDGKIQEIGKSANLKNKYKNIQTLDLGRGILLPGFVNAHTHLELGWIKKSIGEFDGFIGWLRQIIGAKMEGIMREEIEVSVQNGIKSLIESGVTTVGEISSYDGLDKPLLKGSGLRTVLFKELFDRHEDFWSSLSFEKEEIFEERPFPHAPYSCSPPILSKILRLYYEREIPIGIHLAESPDEVKFLRGEENGFEQAVFPMLGKEAFFKRNSQTPFEYLKELKFFNGTKITTVHMVHTLPQEVEEIGKFDIGIVLCPRSNLFLKVGSPPIKYYAKLERIGIGTDGLSSNINLDLLEELRFFYLTFAKELGKKAAFFTVYLATLGGAKSLFLEDKIGSIEMGKDADLIFLSPKYISNDPYLSVISSSKGDLRLSMVKGKIIYSDISFG